MFRFPVVMVVKAHVTSLLKDPVGKPYFEYLIIGDSAIAHATFAASI
jgi:hypothetical protein